MSKQLTAPPPGDKPTPSNPPRATGLAALAAPVGVIAALWLWIYLPAVHEPSPTSLSYSQWMGSDVHLLAGRRGVPPAVPRH
jgi:hypothetical protein